MTRSGVAEAEASSPGPAPLPTGHDVPRIVHVLVFLRDRGIFMLWGLLIVAFATSIPVAAAIAAAMESC